MLFKKIPHGFVGIATLCNITVDGMLLKKGIPVEVKYSAVLGIKADAITATAMDVIWYDGTTIDPTRLFMARKMHATRRAMEEGEGKIIANYREVPKSAKEEIKEGLKEMRKASIDGGAMLKEKKDGRLGIFLCSGINAIAAVEEAWIKTMTESKNGVFKCKEMKEG